MSHVRDGKVPAEAHNMAPCAEGGYERQRASLMSLTLLCVQRQPGGTRAALMQENMLERNILYMHFFFLMRGL